jgi:hypothetical protein
MTRLFDFGYVPKPAQQKAETRICEECSDPATHLTGGGKWLCEEHWFALLENGGGYEE